jgi:hypothetical protein
MNEPARQRTTISQKRWLSRRLARNVLPETSVCDLSVWFHPPGAERDLAAELIEFEIALI